jgi:hypothetical protein
MTQHQNMNRQIRPLAALTALALLALIGAGCSSGGDSGDGGDAAAAQGDAVKFSQCMRDNGVAEFPDPDASGELTVDAVVNGSSFDTDSPPWTTAIDTCEDLQPAGFTGTEPTPEQEEVRLEFAQCMRDNGVPSFPDPEPGGPMIDTTRFPGNPDPQEIPGLDAAMTTCGDLYGAELGITGP